MPGGVVVCFADGIGRPRRSRRKKIILKKMIIITAADGREGTRHVWNGTNDGMEMEMKNRLSCSANASIPVPVPQESGGREEGCVWN